MTPEERRWVQAVSRSFYLSLKILPASVRSVMALGYVLCRAADTIADTDLIPPQDRLETLRKFLAAFDSFPVDAKRLGSVLPPSYEWCEAAFRAAPPTHQAFIQKVVVSVIQGMIIDLETFGDSAETLKAFRSNKNLEQYLAWIGGEPGRFWTEVLLHNNLFPPSAARDLLFEKGIEFGKGLQMVNILKDLPEDLKRGRCYLPEERLRQFNLVPTDLLTAEKNEAFLTLYQELLDETAARLENGLAYIGQFGAWDWRLRAAVWWPLVLGLKTLNQLRKTPDVLSLTSQRKIKRAEVYKTILESTVILPSEKALRWEFKRLY